MSELCNAHMTARHTHDLQAGAQLSDKSIHGDENEFPYADHAALLSELTPKKHNKSYK